MTRARLTVLLLMAFASLNPHDLTAESSGIGTAADQPCLARTRAELQAAEAPRSERDRSKAVLPRNAVHRDPSGPRSVHPRRGLPFNSYCADLSDGPQAEPNLAVADDVGAGEIRMAGKRVASSSTNNWPMWRGPNGDGVSPSAGAPLHWSPEQNIAWKTRIPGVGHSSPVVWGDTVFVTSADSVSKQRTLFNVDRVGGEIRWRRDVVSAEIEPMHRDNSAASATPATDGERVFVTFQAGEKLLVAAYDFAGDLLWKKTPGPFASRHGFHTCPVLFEDSIFISGMQDGPGAFLARLDRETGETVWKASIDSPIRSFSSPMAISANGRRQIVLSGANRTYSFDPADGRLLWHVRGPAEKTVSSLSFDGQRVFVPGGRDNQLFAIRPTGTGDVTGSHVDWVARRGIPYVSSPRLCRRETACCF